MAGPRHGSWLKWTKLLERERLEPQTEKPMWKEHPRGGAGTRSKARVDETKLIIKCVPESHRSSPKGRQGSSQGAGLTWLASGSALAAEGPGEASDRARQGPPCVLRAEQRWRP